MDAPLDTVLTQISQVSDLDILFSSIFVCLTVGLQAHSSAYLHISLISSSVGHSSHHRVYMLTTASAAILIFYHPEGLKESF
jgi:hypothetical protein